MPRTKDSTWRGLVLRKFFAKVEKTDTCWNWTGETTGGYGNYGGRKAHRLSYRQFVGPIPEELEIDHLCRNPLCVNPEHLEPVTREENIRRRVAARTHCPHGHEFTPENTYVRDGHNARVCRKCVVIRHRSYVQRKRAASHG